MNVAIGVLAGADADIVADGAMRPLPPAVQRLNGWKCIAAHFGRDRTTVIRWARERNLPVYRLPGGRTGTVYALRHELDRWAGFDGGLANDPGREPEDGTLVPEAESDALPASGSAVSPRVLMALLVLAVIAFAAAAYDLAWRRAPEAPLAMALPADPAVASRYLAARDRVAGRQAGSLEQGIVQLEAVTRDAPGFASGYAALGEALLLSREFGRRSDGEAFMRARQAARTAIRLDADLAAGHRVLGFIAYWADGDFTEAGERFRQALAADPKDGMTHFWYGNVLSDHGDHAAALRALNRARLLLPGSVAIQTDLAWARWAAGEDAAAVAALQEIARRNPDFAGAHDCLSVIALLRGDDAGHVRHFTTLARLRANPQMIARAQALAAAMQAGGAPAMHALLLRQATEDLREGDRSSEWAIAVASVMHDRDRTLGLLAEAERRGEQWGEAALQRRIAAIWAADREISSRLARFR